MTREEAIAYLDGMRIIPNDIERYKKIVEERNTVIDMAIEALSAPIDGDLIKRQDAIDAVTGAIWHYPNECYKNLNVYEVAEALVSDAIKALPSARPTGHWIDNTNGTFACDQCGCKHSKSRFCPNCGAKMEVEHEID